MVCLIVFNFNEKIDLGYNNIAFAGYFDENIRTGVTITATGMVCLYIFLLIKFRKNPPYLARVNGKIHAKKLLVA